MEEKIVSIKNEIATLTEGAEFLVCEDRAGYECLLKQEDMAQAMKSQVEEYWAEPIAKAHSLHKDLTTRRKAMLDPLESFIKAVKRVAGGYLALEQKKAQEQAVALQKQASEMGLDTSLVPQADTKPIVGEGRTMVQTWTFDVTDENLVPRKYLILNTALIRDEVRALKDKTQIPGITPRMETSVRRTGR